MSLQQIFHQYSSVSSIFACIVLTIFYVASLYIWRSNHNRDHPSIIKRRFFSVFCMMIIAPFFTQYFITEETWSRGDFYAQLGLRSSGMLYASIFPLILTMILFLGSFTVLFFSGYWKIYLAPVYWISSLQDLVWLRNNVVAPLSEEWVFRACMMPLLLQCFSPFTAVFVGPVHFGIAHVHHVYDLIKAGCELKIAIWSSVIQFGFTTLFGAYSSMLFLRTGHLAPCLIAHMFCNLMGLPNISVIFEYPPWQRKVIIANYFIGLALFLSLLVPMTSPDLYDNRLGIL